MHSTRVKHRVSLASYNPQQAITIVVYWTIVGCGICWYTFHYINSLEALLWTSASTATSFPTITTMPAQTISPMVWIWTNFVTSSMPMMAVRSSKHYTRCVLWLDLRCLRTTYWLQLSLSRRNASRWSALVPTPLRCRSEENRFPTYIIINISAIDCNMETHNRQGLMSKEMLLTQHWTKLDGQRLTPYSPVQTPQTIKPFVPLSCGFRVATLVSA